MSSIVQQQATVFNRRHATDSEVCVTKAAASEQQQATVHMNNGRQLCVTAGYSEQQQATVNSSTHNKI